MDKLEQYLDQVCRGIAGPRSLRQHIRQELREHIQEAIAQYQASGVAPDEALAKALENFGGPEQVGAELEATHGHRVMTVILDKAMQWKEKTMKAKWIWSTWAHAAIILAIALETTFIYACLIFILPKFNELVKDRWIDVIADERGGAINRWGHNVLLMVASISEQGWWIALAAIALWVLFEWRVRSENKGLMRLAGLGSAAALLLIPAFFSAAALILPLTVNTGPYYHQETGRIIAEDAARRIEAANSQLEAAIRGNDWSAVQLETQQLLSAIWLLQSSGAGMPLPGEDTATSGQARIKAASTAMLKARDAATHNDKQTFDRAMQEYHQAYAKLRPTPAATQ
jgi:hypothetical protein